MYVYTGSVYSYRTYAYLDVSVLYKYKHINNMDV